MKIAPTRKTAIRIITEFISTGDDRSASLRQDILNACLEFTATSLARASLPLNMIYNKKDSATMPAWKHGALLSAAQALETRFRVWAPLITDVSLILIDENRPSLPMKAAGLRNILN